MKQRKNHFTKVFGLSIALTLMFGLMPLQSEAQSIKRQCISSYGASAVSDGVYYGQTAGQPYHTQAHADEESSTLQGFQQPAVFTVEEIAPAVEAQNLNISIFPNPAVHSVTLESKDVLENATVQITDINGKTISSEKVEQLQKHTVNCEGLTSGIYFINITDQNQNTHSYKLIINK